MAHTQIQCQNCGAKYKIPETFKGDTAKCKQCGAVIDVAAQRQAPATQASESTAASPRSSRRSQRRDTRAGRSNGGERGSRRSSSRRRRGAAEEATEQKPKEKPRRSTRAAGRGKRRGQHDEEEDQGEERGGRRSSRRKDSTPIVVGAIIGVLAIVTVVLVYSYWDKVAGKIAPPDPNAQVAEAKPEDAAAKKREEELAAQKAEEEERLAKEAADKKAAAKKAKEAAAKKPKKQDDLKSKSDIYKPKEALQPLPLPDGASPEQVKKVNELLDSVLAGGLHGIRAKNELATMGWVALVPTINKMRELDYTTVEGNRVGFELDRLIKSVTGWESGFDPAIYEGEEFPLKTAHQNAQIVRDLQARTRGKAIWSTADSLHRWKKKNVK